ncbi:PEGA domain-containing protein [Candidatus Peregrinibacteria bacterium]|nr:PEGA domain-containing protein [Candidatus Peregrinibacteria bacterium]
MKKIILKILGQVLYLGVFTSLFGFSIFITQGYRYSFDQNEIIQTGVIDLCVLPKTSEVYLDGKPYSGNSCAKLYGLSIGPHRLEVRKMGYFSWKKEVMVDKTRASVFPKTMLVPLPDFWTSATLEKGVKKIWASPNGSRFAAYNPGLNIIKIFSAARPDPVILEVPAAIKNLTWIDNKTLAADTDKGQFETSLGENGWELVTDLARYSLSQEDEVIVRNNEIWRKNNTDYTFITRLAEAIESANFFYHYSNLLIATEKEIRLCDSVVQNCQKISDKDAGTPVANPFHSKKLIFVRNGDLIQLTLNGPKADWPEINI